MEWARRCHALIVEDDYDGEFRYDRQPVGALQHLDPEHVIYVGTASKTLAPGLRLGWLNPPAGMTEALRSAKEHLDRGTSALEQLTLAELIVSGAFDRHIRRMRGIYRRRRDELVYALARTHPGLRLTGISAGLHALAYLPEHGPSERQVRSRAARHSLALHTLSSYWHHSPQPAPQAIIIGYATPQATPTAPPSQRSPGYWPTKGPATHHACGPEAGRLAQAGNPGRLAPGGTARGVRCARRPAGPRRRTAAGCASPGLTYELGYQAFSMTGWGSRP